MRLIVARCEVHYTAAGAIGPCRLRCQEAALVSRRVGRLNGDRLGIRRPTAWRRGPVEWPCRHGGHLARDQSRTARQGVRGHLSTVPHRGRRRRVTATSPFDTQVTSLALDPSTAGTAYADDAATHGVLGDRRRRHLAPGRYEQHGADQRLLLVLLLGGGSDSTPEACSSASRGALRRRAWTSLNNGPSRASGRSQWISPPLSSTPAPSRSTGSRAFKTVDGGGHWNPVNNGLPVGTTGIAVVGLAMDQSNTAVVTPPSRPRASSRPRTLAPPDDDERRPRLGRRERGRPRRGGRELGAASTLTRACSARTTAAGRGRHE
jgi:hypothetical protein